VKYLIAVRPYDGKIIWIYGPYIGASNDLTLLHDSNFQNMLERNEKVLGDAIFRGFLYITR